jgi:2-polyprenyl-6-hydroxyphenyl methylase/3-demethylubiquinone-9 3-methyltransferase
MNRKQPITRNDLSIYDTHADVWWTGEKRWLRLLQNMVPARLDYFTTVVGDWRGKSVLDLGCGGGFMSEALAQRGAHVIGVDPSAPAIAIARKHAEASGFAIDYRIGAGEGLRLAANSIDIVVCVDVLEHVENLDCVIDEIRRVLKPGGLFLFDTINRNGLATFVMVTIGETLLRLLPPGTHDPARFIKPVELADRLKRRAFIIAPVVGFGPCGLDRRFDFTFGTSPTTALAYIGHARSDPDPPRWAS